MTKWREGYCLNCRGTYMISDIQLYRCPSCKRKLNTPKTIPEILPIMKDDGTLEDVDDD